MERGARQGSARTPMCWNHIAVGPLERARAEADARLGPDVSLSEELARWSSFIWSTASSSCPVHRRGSWGAAQFESTLAELQQNPSAKSVEVLQSRWAEEPRAPPHICAGPLQVVQVLLVLGVSLDHEGSAQTMVRERLNQATSTWGKWRHLLAIRGQSVEVRIHQMYTTVVASVTWGAPLRPPSPSACRHDGRGGRQIDAVGLWSAQKQWKGTDWFPWS